MVTQMNEEFPTEISGMGYWVFPLGDGQKYPAGGIGPRRRTWRELLEEGGQERAHAILEESVRRGATGAAVCPRPDDPVPLLVLDVDTPGLGAAAVWRALGCPGRPPEHLVRTPGGGWHIYFRLPDPSMARRLPRTFAFGGSPTLKGDVRVSGEAAQLLVLPGSHVRRSDGSSGAYECAQPPHPSRLCEPPDALLARLLARPEEDVREPDGIPTETHHLLRLLALVDEIPRGGQNNALAQIGQIAGRLSGRGDVSGALLSAIEATVRPRMPGAEDWTPVQVAKAVRSGWRRGRKNAEQYTPRDKYPTATDIEAECSSLFGHMPWLHEIQDAKGQTREYVLGLGGTAETPQEAQQLVTVHRIEDAFMDLARAASADLDAILRSPIKVQTSWDAAFRFVLLARRKVERTGSPPEQLFWEILGAWASQAAADGAFTDGYRAAAPDGRAVWIAWPLGGSGQPSLMVHPRHHDHLRDQVGNYAVARRLLDEHVEQYRTAGGRAKPRWRVPLQTLADHDTIDFAVVEQEYVAAQR